MINKALCPHCMDDREVKVLEIKDTIQVQEDQVIVKSKVIVCQTCFKEFNNQEVPNLALENAYDAYRKSHNLLSPNQIKYYRLAYNYSYLDLAKKTGINPEKIEAIERGSIHTKKEDIAIRKALGL